MIKELLKIILSSESNEFGKIKYELDGYKFTWDDKKFKTNLEKHKINFKLAAEACIDDNAIEETSYIKDGEERISLIGKTSSDSILVVIFVERILINNNFIIRIISARQANEKEVYRYENEI